MLLLIRILAFVAILAAVLAIVGAFLDDDLSYLPAAFACLGGAFFLAVLATFIELLQKLCALTDEVKELNKQQTRSLKLQSELIKILVKSSHATEYAAMVLEDGHFSEETEQWARDQLQQR